MKSKISILWILILSVFVFSNLAVAEPAIIKDIVIDTQDSAVKISITSNQTLQIETFKNDLSSPNYIVLDFLGTVYTNLSSVIEVDGGPVEKVILVRGDDEKITLTGKEYYALDFLAVNLNKAADYNINQSKAVIDLNIGTVAGMSAAEEASPVQEKAVELTPPIVVSKAKETPVATSYRRSEYSASSPTYSKDTYRSRTILNEEKPYSSAEQLVIKKPVEEKVVVIPKEKKRRRRSKPFFGRKKRKVKKEKVLEPEKVVVQEKISEKIPERVKKVRTRAKTLPFVDTTDSDYLIDRIVNETIRNKESVASRIEDLTCELKRMQEELSLSKGEKSKVEQKINEILAKLDQLQNALEEEIKRRQALGEKVDDLLSKRDQYIKAKKAFEEFKAKLARLTGEVQVMTGEFKSIRQRLDELQGERKQLAGEVKIMETEYTESKTEYDKVIRLRESISIKIDKIARELEQLRRELDLQIEEKAQIIAQLKDSEERSKYSGMELVRLRQLLEQKDATLLDITGRYNSLKGELDVAVAEKFKVEFSYRNAKIEFDRIKEDIERFLHDSTMD